MRLHAALIQNSYENGSMDDISIDPKMMGQLAHAVGFICGADHATTMALKKAADSGAVKDIAAARKAFLKLKPSERRGALSMLEE
jgi:hypothetical protein